MLLIALVLIWFYRNTAYRLFDEPLSSAVTALIASAEIDRSENNDPVLTLSREPIDPRYQRALSGQYWMVGTVGDDGQLMPIVTSRSLSDESLSLAPEDIINLRENQGEEIRSYLQGPDQNEELRLVARQVVLPEMDHAVIILAAADRRPATRAVRNFALTASGLLILLSIGLITAILTQVRSGLRPLFQLADRVTDVREGVADHVDGDYPRELQPLATELNSLISHNRDVVERAQTHVGNLAHALKTPLAVLQNEADASSSKLAGIIRRQTETMKNQVDHHLRRARAAARGQSIGVSTEIGPVFDALIRTLERIYANKDIAMSSDIDDTLVFRGEKRDLEEMVGNLLDNAYKWTGTRISVSAATNPGDESEFNVVVSDNGPGMADDEYALALKRGARLDEATPGTGFGLAIVDDLARAYNGSLTLGRSKEGGLRAMLTLPRRP